VIIAGTIDDKMSELWQKGAGDEQLRDAVRARFGTICCMLNVTTPEEEGTNEFEFQNAYKSQGESAEQFVILRKVSYCAFPLIWNCSLFHSRSKPTGCDMANGDAGLFG